MEPVRVLVTGAAGQIAYSLILQIGKGDVFGPCQPVILHLLDIAPAMGILEGVVMEIEDCALPLVADIVATDDVNEACRNVDAAFLVGSMPRKQGMERKDLLRANVKIFKVQGQALDKYAKKSAKVLVVGNPANTNALICAKYAPSLPKENFSAMTRLDQNRVDGCIAKRLNVTADKIKNTVIWGNHSSTQFPDVKSATVELQGKVVPVCDAIKNDGWIEGDFIKTIQLRGAAVINARKNSSAMSAAKAAADHMKDIWFGTSKGEFVSMGVWSDGSYGIPKDIVFSFPVTLRDKTWNIVSVSVFYKIYFKSGSTYDIRFDGGETGSAFLLRRESTISSGNSLLYLKIGRNDYPKDIKIDDFARNKLDVTAKELIEEREEALIICEE